MVQSQYRKIIFYIVLFNLTNLNICINFQTRNLNLNIKKLNACTTTSMETMIPHTPKTVTFLIGNKIILSDSVYKTLYSDAKICQTTNLLNNSISNDKNIIITIKSMNQLYEFFDTKFYSMYWKYLIITDLHKNELLDIANFIWKHNYIYVAFLIVSDNGNVTFHKFDYNEFNKNEQIFLNDYDCTDVSRELSHTVSFKSFDCLSYGCSLAYVRVNEGVELPQYIQPAKMHSRGGFIIDTFCNELEWDCNKILSINLTWNISMDWINQGKADIVYGSDLPADQQIHYLGFSGSYG